MFPKLVSTLSVSRKAVNLAFARNIGSTTVVLNKLDPIQQLFLDKSKEYYKKKRFLFIFESLIRRDFYFILFVLARQRLV